MSTKEQLKKVSEETMRFMRGKYRLDELGGKSSGIDWLKFRQGKRTIVAIYIYEDRYDFQIIYGKKEQEIFETRINEFPQEIQDLYKGSRVYHDGLWMMISVDNLEKLEVIKQMIMIKKKPNRKPLSKENAIYAACGHRCDMCVHYRGGTISDERREDIKKRLIRVYADGVDDGGYWGDDMEFCDGCASGGISKVFDCEPFKCAGKKGHKSCADCGDFDKSCKPYVGYRGNIEPKSLSTDDITWAIFPYMTERYWD